MTKDVRFSVRLAQAGADLIADIAKETGANRSEVARDALGIQLSTPANRQALTKRIKARKGIE